MQNAALLEAAWIKEVGFMKYITAFVLYKWPTGDFRAEIFEEEISGAPDTVYTDARKPSTGIIILVKASLG